MELTSKSTCQLGRELTSKSICQLGRELWKKLDVLYLHLNPDERRFI